MMACPTFFGHNLTRKSHHAEKWKSDSPTVSQPLPLVETHYGSVLLACGCPGMARAQAALMRAKPSRRSAPPGS